MIGDCKDRYGLKSTISSYGKMKSPGQKAQKNDQKRKRYDCKRSQSSDGFGYQRMEIWRCSSHPWPNQRIGMRIIIVLL